MPGPGPRKRPKPGVRDDRAGPLRALSVPPASSTAPPACPEVLISPKG
ncbi:hypothetical protein CU044_3479 [Streptomyces sp. L-9-10]|nr:hypothetical protein CU044_3479 [Streptomyces sp. L-9-10]